MLHHCFAITTAACVNINPFVPCGFQLDLLSFSEIPISLFSFSPQTNPSASISHPFSLCPSSPPRHRSGTRPTLRCGALYETSGPRGTIAEGLRGQTLTVSPPAEAELRAHTLRSPSQSTIVGMMIRLSLLTLGR